MNFITKFLKLVEPTTKTKYNLIIIIVDRLIKYIYFILFKKTFDAEQLGHLFVDKIIKYQKFSEKIISDRNKFFILIY